MKLASTVVRFRKLSKPGRAMPGKTRVTRIGCPSLEQRAEDAGLGVPGERCREAARQGVPLVVADRGAETRVGEGAVHALAVGEEEVGALGTARRGESRPERETVAGETVDAEQLRERQHPLADRCRPVAG